MALDAAGAGRHGQLGPGLGGFFTVADREKYVREFTRAVAALPDALQTPEPPEHPGKIPNQATTSFIVNLEQGRWGEAIVADMINGQADGLSAVAYGQDSDIIAGEPGFEEHYARHYRELITEGKRSDLLLFVSGGQLPEPRAVPDGAVREAVAALEVRSSAQNVANYYEHYSRPENRAAGSQYNLSFTMKAEDIRHVHTWVRRRHVPHFYVQVFDDCVYAANTLDLLRAVSDPAVRAGRRKPTVKRAKDNHFKSTVMLDIAYGVRLGEIVEEAGTKPITRRMPAGKVLRYVGLYGGKAQLDRPALAALVADGAHVAGAGALDRGPGRPGGSALQEKLLERAAKARQR